ncbi:VOC family protein [Flavobacterium arcticum]|uniref:VOC family protein n=1 Tax=Flavobacterium arcticum TaxID=1784713 RepID=A0A345HA83_9FLAO|nr:VOC family protein [Flavobacterium arcticum]AXG73493.1 VOC family protein [Flavobacterium arcticum]KAF2513282.1 VOC family protein [Flavobacterium arcticum]
MNFRVARHTNNLDKIIAFYTNILDLEILGSFNNHDNYDGVFIGLKDMSWHLEFTKSDEIVNHKFNDDDILVFYPETDISYSMIIENINIYQIKKLNPKNPYWNLNGILIQDPDGFNIIISNLKAQKNL